MAGFNPFAPQMEKKVGAPQLQGHQTPNVAMETEPGLMQKFGPAMAEHAMKSDEAGAIKDWGFDKAKEAWNAFSPASPEVIPVSELSTSAAATAVPQGLLPQSVMASNAAQAAAMAGEVGMEASLMGSSAPVIAGHSALAGGLGTAMPAVSSMAGAAAGTTTAVAPAALAAGPFAPLVLIGAGLMAANSGK